MPEDAITLGELVAALDRTVATLVEAPEGERVPLRSVALGEPADLAGVSGALPEVYLLVGADPVATAAWLRQAGQREQAHRPRVLITKNTDDAPGVRAAARDTGIALVRLHQEARWDQVFPLVRRLVTRAPGRRTPTGDHDLLAPDTDLFGLAQVVAAETGGMVSIEDPSSHVLAYSASDSSADRLRIESILGREGPADYLRILRAWGVYDRVRRTDEVVDVPEHPELDMRRRLVVGIRRGTGPRARMLGTLWLQQGARPLRPDAAQVLRGAAAVAARIIARRLDAPSTEALLIRRLFGAHGDGVDVPSVVAALGLPVEGPAAVIGFAALGTADGPTTGRGRASAADSVAAHDPRAGLGSAAEIGAALAPAAELAASSGLIRLHASAFRGDSVTEAIGDRVYVLVPSYHSTAGVGSWVRELVAQLEQARGLLVRAAIAAPVAGLTAVAAAREEVDRVLDSPADPAARVTTLAEARTAVLLTEIVELIRDRPYLHDPRLAALDAYDRTHAADLRATARAYLRAHGEVSAAAAALRIHPNTLRYRLRRIESVLGISLSDPADRLLLELQLAAAPDPSP
ncbi:PucR family transcriptional regulator [Nocardia sp. AG03]|uniref:PucR family transcriptional regulator n=1 Tax=Nocardia sp. AG03 TaxID=3025312 RepID=UPI00241881E7|nr:PucR family transcriptional regulator [Nocardia sp. AG03]